MVACGGTGTVDRGDGQSAGRSDTGPEVQASTEGTVLRDTSITAAQAAQEELTPTVMALDGVVGTAVGLCGDVPCIKVYLARDDDGLRAEIPETFKGFRVDVEVSGEFEARDDGP